MASRTVSLIGFGEAASTFASAAKWGREVIAFDIDPRRANAIEQAGLTSASDALEALADAPIALSLVTADQALKAASRNAAFLSQSALWLDMNSVAPSTKRAAALAVDAAGGRYVDVAVLAPVNPARLAVPMLLSGPAAEAARVALEGLGFSNVRVVGEEVGRASAIKMIRSIMIKGIEALTAEMIAAAEAAGVTDEVLASLDASERHEPWPTRAEYNLERMTTHGIRRAAEMEQVGVTLRLLGVDPIMTEGARRRQAMSGASHQEQAA